MGERRKLIEVALPLEAINRAATHEKSVPRKGHPATMHLWWARRPLATARAVLFAQLVDDPDSSPEAAAIADPEERATWVSAERARLFRLIEELVTWENSTNERLINAARAEIMRSTGGNPPPILDPFAGGGTIPLEAQRLGLEVHASDLNPVAVLITKALIEIAPKFAGRPPVFQGAADESLADWPRAAGLADDVRRYGAWMREEAQRRIGHLYPKATLDDGTEATVIAWIWARTVTCPNPACGITMPLVRSWWLGRKKGKESYIVPEVVNGEVRYTIGHDPARGPSSESDGTVGRSGASCINCLAAVELKYVRAEAKDVGLGAELMAIVAEGKRSRSYVLPSASHVVAAAQAFPGAVPVGAIPAKAPSFRVQAYGFENYADLFTNRQLVALTTFSDLIGEARERVLSDSLASGMTEGKRLAEGGSDAAAYADAVATFLACANSKLADWSSTICTWISPIEGVRDTFARQALPMTWDYTEINPLSNSVGNFGAHCQWVAATVETSLAWGERGYVVQADASVIERPGAVISTDPPYYDNIGYSDLSDFFYVWLRRSLRKIHPDLFGTVLVPKAEELVANPFRHGGKKGAQQFFEAGFREVFARARVAARDDFPITVYYAFKQSETDEVGSASTGWETLLDGMVRSGWRITGTWPMRSERSGRMISVGTNSLASSIVLALRPRHHDAPVVDRRAFITELRATLPDKLRELQQGSIAPVDLPQGRDRPRHGRFLAVFAGRGGRRFVDGSAFCAPGHQSGAGRGPVRARGRFRRRDPMVPEVVRVDRFRRRHLRRRGDARLGVQHLGLRPCSLRCTDVRRGQGDLLAGTPPCWLRPEGRRAHHPLGSGAPSGQSARCRWVGCRRATHVEGEHPDRPLLRERAGLSHLLDRGEEPLVRDCPTFQSARSVVGRCGGRCTPEHR